MVLVAGLAGAGEAAELSEPRTLPPTASKLAPASPDEALAEKFSMVKAAESLDSVSLRQSGMAASDDAIQRGANWLRTHQRASGRWFTPSLNGVKEHFISHAGTAFAVTALRACE